MEYCEFQQLQKPTPVKEISFLISFSSCKEQTGEVQIHLYLYQNTYF